MLHLEVKHHAINYSHPPLLFSVFLDCFLKATHPHHMLKNENHPAFLNKQLILFVDFRH